LINNDMTHYCYLLRFPNGKGYVGYTSLTPQQRFRSHWKQRKEKRFPVQRAMCKYNKEDIVLETIAHFDTQEKALEAEQYYIEKFNTYAGNGNGYNATLGGEAPCMTWMETKTKEEIDDINKRKGNSGEKNPFYGKTHSEETKQKAVETRKKNGNGDYFQGKENPLLSKKVREQNRIRMKTQKPITDNTIIEEEKETKEQARIRMKTNNPMKDKTIARKASKKRMDTITTFEYWLNQYFYSKLGDQAKEIESYLLSNLETVKSREIQEKFNIKRDFADSMIKRFKEQTIVDCQLKEVC